MPEKEIARSIALNKINAELAAAQSPASEIREKPDRVRRFGRGFGRRGFAIAAVAASLVLVFTVVAFATGLLDLGTIRSANGDYEVAMQEDSPQLKAMQEYQDYADEVAAKGGNPGWVAYGTGENGVYTDEYAYPEKISELCEKYGLREENVMYTPDTFGETLAGAGVENFLGTFGGLSADTKSKYAGEFKASKAGYFEYWNLGSFSIGMPLDDGSTGSHHAYWYVKGVKTDVFTPSLLEGWSADFYGSEPGAKKWEYNTDDGYTVKCSLIQQDTGNSGLNEVYNFVLAAGDYMLKFQMRQPIPKEESGVFTEAGLEKIIDEFDFELLEK
jgi:hypothetical protein